MRQVGGAVSAARDTAWQALLSRACRVGAVEDYSDATLIDISDDMLTLELSPAQWARGLDRRENLARLGDAIHRAVGRPVGVAIELRRRKPYP